MVRLFLYISLACLSVLIAVLVRLLRGTARSRRHAFRRRQAERIYEKLNDGTFDAPRTIGYLRKINPYTFEELVLLSFERKGVTVKRNLRYSGDGGADGFLLDGGTMIPLQMKRYHGYVRMEHIRDFASLCSFHSERGFFVHTGKTGKGAKGLVRHYKGVTVISGTRLCDLIDKTKPFNLR